jgi:lipopolysaccharide/colanic/teichoic acid biosynthesis glycosyltransferase
MAEIISKTCWIEKRSEVSVHEQIKKYEMFKRIFDIAVCLLLLPIVLVILLICGILLWIENPGPIFFNQLRTGKSGHRFRMYKLRTMVSNAEKLKEELLHLNELTWPDFKISSDPRITRVGKFLRKTSIDELPQLFNVLKGDMSLVGPRPTSFSSKTYTLWHTERLEVTPGITGLWQISGRSDVDFDDRLKLDIEYLNKRSFFFDLILLYKTIFAVIKPRGAY